MAAVQAEGHDGVRVMTVHAAKGLQFPMVVVSGLSSKPNTRGGVQLLWTDDGFAISLGKDLTTGDFADAQPVDEQMSDLEKQLREESAEEKTR